MYKKLIFILIMSLLASSIAYAFYNDNVVALVLDDPQQTEHSETIKAKIMEGKYKDTIITIERELLKDSVYDFNIEKDDKILIELYEDESNNLNANFINIWRLDKLKHLALILFIMVLIFGKIKGTLSLLSLLFSGFIIIKFMIPAILKGYDAILVSIIYSSIIIIVSFIMIAGFTKKSFASILGTIGGTAVAGALANIYSKAVKVTGFANEDVGFIVSNMGVTIDFRGLYISAVIIGSIGVVMDVSMSITSSIFEIKKHSPRISRNALINSGFEVGKDIMSTMINTLVLAYTGSSIPLLMIYVASEASVTYALNSELIAIEIIKSLCGSIGLVFTIPFTVFIASSMAQKSRMGS
ncbi:YibE/F family protein [Xylanivirga thermophila]|uniref:YibE/F family protein n=1 Tax=Xylanivirga thermophila TaxID=2496273 RepID=UPI00101D2A0F|nr:YibE/F family protein [Xylanivirga thermophila]